MTLCDDDDISITKSFSSFQDNEQTSRIIESEIFYEIKKCTHCNVDDFFEKYFQEQFWNRKNKAIYNVVNKQYKNEQ